MCWVGDMRSRALNLVLMLGLVSLFADVTYEGARSIVGPYLGVLGASALAVGFVSGFGELLGYGLRLASGALVDRSKRYWLILFLGYFVNLFSVPLLAFAGRWEVAALLLFAERLGKAVRTPARDVVISYASSSIGLGRGYALHEALDQVGAVLGPFFVAAVFIYGGGYREGFALLALPAAVALILLASLSRIHPKPERMERVSNVFRGADGGGVVKAYLLFVGFCVAGLAPFQLIAFHMSILGFADADIPLLYALAMVFDAAAALLVGRFFDRFGLLMLAPIPIFTSIVPAFAFTRNPGLVVSATLLWGVIVGMHETILRAGVATIMPAAKRGFGFGALNAVLGFSWFLGGSVIGWLYNIGFVYVVAFSISAEICSVPPLILMVTRLRRLHADDSQKP